MTVAPSNPTGNSRALALRGVSKTYGEGELAVHALQEIDLEIDVEEFVVLLGPSGSGKTTLLNVIGGIEPPSGGEIVVAGRDVSQLDDLMSPEDYQKLLDES